MDEEKKFEKIGDENESNSEADINVSDKNVIKENENHNKILIWVLVAGGIVLAGILSFYLFNQSLNRFDDGGFNYDIINGGKVTFYHTSFITYDKANKINYNVYLRTDPRELQKIEFEGEMNRKEMLVINNSDQFSCEGKGVIAIANMGQILKAVKIKPIVDPNSTCDDEGRYTIVDMQPGNETKIEQYGPSCYKIYIKNCEVLEGTEKYVVEVLKDSNLLNLTKS